MGSKTLNTMSRLVGDLTLPGDKSISHRALLLGALAEKTTTIEGLLQSGDVASTQACLRQLGVKIEQDEALTRVHGHASLGGITPKAPLDCGNSGTTMRLLMGVAAGRGLAVTLVGDASLHKRPMARIATPLRKMGAVVTLREDQYAPVQMSGHQGLLAVKHKLEVASAQLKSALLLAGLDADGTTVLTGEIQSRDHTERMLAAFGANLEHQADAIYLAGKQHLVGTHVQVPGDISSAAFLVAAACMLPKSQLVLRDVGLNPSRLGFLRVLEKMGAKIQTEVHTSLPEPIGHVHIQTSQLQGIRLESDWIPALIDEIPILAVLATQAEGWTLIQGAKELRHKETDRLNAIATNLRAMGVQLELFEDGMAILGPQRLSGGHIQTFDDHRIAMAFSIAALVADGKTKLDHPECVDISYPRFYATLEHLCRA